MNPERWHALVAAFMDRAVSVGVTGRRFVLCLLALFAFLMAIRGISPFWCIAFVVVIYILEPIVDIVRTLFFQRSAAEQLEAARRDFRRHITRREHQLRRSEPELPLPPPKPQPDADKK
jgi:hypothetical protein